MAIIPINLDDIQEMRPVPAGKYKLHITDVEEVQTRNGKPQFQISIAIEGHDDAPNVRHYLSLPAEGDEPDALRFKALLLKRFCRMFGVPLTGNELDTEALAAKLQGKRAVGELILDKERDTDGNEKPGGRTFNRLVVPYLDDEPRSAPKPPKF